MTTSSTVSAEPFDYSPSNHSSDSCSVIGAFLSLALLFGVSALFG